MFDFGIPIKTYIVNEKYDEATISDGTIIYIFNLKTKLLRQKIWKKHDCSPFNER